MTCKEEYNDVLNNKTKAERYRFRILSAFFHSFCYNISFLNSKGAVKKQAVVIVRSDRRGNSPRLHLGFVGMPRGTLRLAMTAFFHSPLFF